MNRDIDVFIDTSTWTRSPVPLELMNHDGTTATVSMLDVLLRVAVWMRPPTVYGFSLSDCWAWMRYLPAIAPCQKLMLREEWTALDPHHKTVLSGDFGVGIGTLFLERWLGLVDFADTLRVVNVIHPTKFRLGKTSRRGPSKSPDYIAVNGSGEFSVVECKGGQSTRESMIASMKTGEGQKANVTTVGGTPLLHSLVAGTYVPQWGASKAALFALRDPPWEELNRTIRSVDPTLFGRAVQQVSAAKQFAALELGTTANSMVRAARGETELGRAIDADLRETRALRPQRVETGVQLVRDYRWPEPTDLGDAGIAVGLRYTSFMSNNDLEVLRKVGTPEAAGELLRERRADRRLGAPNVGVDDRVAVFNGSAGVTYRLEILEA